MVTESFSEVNDFHPVIDIGDTREVLDFSKGYDPGAISLDPPSVGRYNEKRRDMYTAGLFGGIRNIHMGIDIWVPAGTPVRAFTGGKVLFFRDNDNPGDYGPTVVTEHKIGPNDAIFAHFVSGLGWESAWNRTGRGGGNERCREETDQPEAIQLYALFGHLARRSLDQLVAGMPLKRGEVFAEVGGEHENGGWVPHLHFQLSWERPAEPDMPGVVSEEDLEHALLVYPDPRFVLGALY